MENLANNSRFVCIARLVSVLHFIASFSLLGIFMREMIFGFLQISGYEPLEWLLMFVTVSFTLVWNIVLGIFIEAQLWQMPVRSVPAELIIRTILFKIWEISMSIFIVVDLIGNLVIYATGPYDWYLVLTWLLPVLLLTFMAREIQLERESPTILVENGNNPDPGMKNKEISPIVTVDEFNSYSMLFKHTNDKF